MKIMAHRRGEARITDSSIISLNELPRFHSLKGATNISLPPTGVFRYKM